MSSLFRLCLVGLLVSGASTTPIPEIAEREFAATDWYKDSAAGVAESLDKRAATDWYKDSAAGVAESLDKRAATDWYKDSAAGVAESLENRAATDWYKDSAAGVAESLEKRAATDWYKDSAVGVAESLEKRAATDWYKDSAAGVAESLEKRAATDWYKDSAAGVAESLEERAATDWYKDSAAGVAESLQKREATDWYKDSAAGIADSLDKRVSDAGPDWYADSASGVAKSLDKRAMNSEEKESYEVDLRLWIYHNMREKPLRESSERGKSFFTFETHPRNDKVDRWHVPAELINRFDSTTSDADRVSILNYYLMVTGREPLSAADLGFAPTMEEPGLVEGNEVGYGYALAGQHQYHCVDFIADAIDIGKDRLNDFYLKHTIHCLGLLKYLAPELKMRQPLAMLRVPANERVKNNYPQTRE